MKKLPTQGTLKTRTQTPQKNSLTSTTTSIREKSKPKAPEDSKLKKNMTVKNIKTTKDSKTELSRSKTKTDLTKKPEEKKPTKTEVHSN
jgi:hypothetical protein